MERIKVRFGVQNRKGHAEIHEGFLPTLGSDELLLKMEICNICTEDYQRWMGLREFKTPMADGHEYVGRIIDLGSKVNTNLFKLGDRVGKLNQQCGICNDCRTGNTGDCKFADHKAIGLEEYHGMKGFATYKILPQRLAIKVSGEIPAEQAAFLEPVATVVQGIKRLHIKPFENVVVIGVGTMGLLNAQVAKYFGANVYMVEISEKKIERANTLNIGKVIDSNINNPVDEIKKLTNGEGADAVILAVGNSIASQQGYAMLKKFKGRLLLFSAGYPEPEFDLKPNELHYRKVEVIGTINADNADFIDAANALDKKLIDVSKSLEGKTFPLSKFADALEAAALPDSYRVSVDLSESN